MSTCRHWADMLSANHRSSWYNIIYFVRPNILISALTISIHHLLQVISHLIFFNSAFIPLNHKFGLAWFLWMGTVPNTNHSREYWVLLMQYQHQYRFCCSGQVLSIAKHRISWFLFISISLSVLKSVFNTVPCSPGSPSSTSTIPFMWSVLLYISVYIWLSWNL